jgi:hypothetical protein
MLFVASLSSAETWVLKQSLKRRTAHRGCPGEARRHQTDPRPAPLDFGTPVPAAEHEEPLDGGGLDRPGGGTGGGVRDEPAPDEEEAQGDVPF